MKAVFGRSLGGNSTAAAVFSSMGNGDQWCGHLGVRKTLLTQW